MANVNAPFGFKYAGRLDGSQPNVGLQTRQINSTYTGPTNQIFYGDPCADSGGYIVQATAPGTTQIAGVFYGCSWMSASQNRIQHSPYWPGTTDAVAGSIQCLICSDPLAQFIVQANAGPYTVANLNQNVQFNYGSGGNTSTGFSGASATGSAVTGTFPFRIIGLYTLPVGTGGDITTPYNWVYVTFNNQDYKVLTGL